MDWQPFEVDPSWPAAGLPPVRGWYEAFAAQAHAFGLPAYQVPAWVPNAGRVSALAEYARAQGRLDALRARAMVAYWEEGRDLDGREALGALAAEAGLDVARALRACTSKKYAQVVEKKRAAAAERGVRGVPAVDFGGDVWVVGAQPYEVFFRAASWATGARGSSNR